MKRLIPTLFLFYIISAGLSAEGSVEHPAEQSNVPTVQIVHKLGATEVPVPPQTTVSFTYDVLDILHSLGIPVAGLPKSHLPAYLKDYDGESYFDAGTLFEPDFEGLYGLHPEVVFISRRQASMYAELSELAPTVYVDVSGDSYLDSVAENAEMIADLYNRSEEVEKLLAGLRSRTAAVAGAAEGKTALFVLVNDSALSVFGPDSRFDVVHSDFGFEAADPDIEVSDHGQNASFEYLAEQNPDYLLVLDRGAAITGTSTAESVLETAILRDTKAWKNGNIVYLDAVAWYLASGGITATDRMIADLEGALGL